MAPGNRASSSTPRVARASTSSSHPSPPTCREPPPAGPPRGRARAGGRTSRAPACRAPPTAAIRPASTLCRRSASSMRGMSMRTGHTSRHAPHRLLACGRSWNASRPRSAGVSTDADRPRIDAAVGVPADLLIHRAGVQARAAADAVEDLGQLAAEHLAAAVVDEHDVQLLGTVGLAGAARAGEDVRVDRELLPGARCAPAPAASRPDRPPSARGARCPSSRRGRAAASSSAGRCLRWCRCRCCRSRRRRSSTPLMPRSACRNASRSTRRANCVMCGTSATSSSVAPSFSRKIGRRPPSSCA